MMQIDEFTDLARKRSICRFKKDTAAVKMRRRYFRLFIRKQQV
jgi:hypothetical protein